MSALDAALATVVDSVLYREVPGNRKDHMTTTFGARLEAAMGVDWNATTLGEKLDIAQQRIHEWLTGGYPSAQYLDAIADFIGEDPHRLRLLIEVEKLAVKIERLERKREGLLALL